MRSINVAISFAVMANEPEQSIYSNGGNQHCVYLYELMRCLPMVKNVWLVHSDGIPSIPPGLLLQEVEKDTKPVSEVIEQVDLLIEMGASLAPEHLVTVRKRGGKVVSYRFGNDYVMTVEIINFGWLEWVPNKENNRFDEIWTNPQHQRTCQAYFQALYRAPCYILPHIWSPMFLERYQQAYPPAEPFGYRNQGVDKRIAMFEPNLNVVKSALIPILACNQVYEERPELIRHVYMTNTYAKRENVAFKNICLNLQLIQDSKASAEGRFNFVPFAAEYTDFIISHQWENDLNFLFYDALYGGYPLVHNSPRLRSVGYYYPDFQVQEAAAVLRYALENHDQRTDVYCEQAEQFLNTLLPNHPDNLESHAQRIKALFAS